MKFVILKNTYLSQFYDFDLKHNAIFIQLFLLLNRNIINIKTNFNFPNYEDINFTLSTKWSDMARDYGNGNRTYDDERIDDYLVNDLQIKSKLWNSYSVFLNIVLNPIIYL